MPFFNPSSTASDTDSSKTNSPPASPSKRPLTISNVSNIFVRMRRVRSDRTDPNSHTHKAHHIESLSAPTPLTHPILEGGVTSARKEPLIQRDSFICAGAVDVPKLLRASRLTLMDKALDIGANALVDEQWTCTICGPKHRSNGNFRVQIRYSASATRSQRPDPGYPVALDQARGVPGLMSILERA